ncbi:MAG: lipid-A-disaccharide synthase [Ancalomicrobiaceae bacterium]|nr:lipid-A-disaccharide synthase [Ancalomicrobiaceae bacterium]
MTAIRPSDPTGRIFIVAGEASGDVLGAGLMRAMRRQRPQPGGSLARDLAFAGVGGPDMRAEGLDSLFPLADIAVMGFGPVIARLPQLIERINRTATAAIALRPDVVVLIDSPDFTHRVAAKVRAALPETPIVVYVSPTVWFWRPGRAKKLARFCDRLLALLPFEPDVHALLGGPPTTFVGHPFVRKLDRARNPAGLGPAPLAVGRRPRLLVLPGSRRSEVTRLLGIFGAALKLIEDRIGPFDLTLPVVDHVRPLVEQGIAGWSVKPRLVAGEAAKLAAFAEADAALAASGTATLELSLAHVPTVAAYRLDWIGRWAKYLLRPPKMLAGRLPVRSAQLTNIIVGDKVMPEFIDGGCTPAVLAKAVAALLSDTPERRRQLDAFGRLDAAMLPEPGFDPDEHAAAAVWQAIADGVAAQQSGAPPQVMGAADLSPAGKADP